MSDDARSLEALFDGVDTDLMVDGMNTTVRTDDEAFATLEREAIDLVCAIWQQPSDLEVTEWAEQVIDPVRGTTNFMLADEAGQVMPGPYSADKGSPLMRYIQNWYSDYAVRVMTWALAAQVGKTLGLNIIHAYGIVNRPGNHMIVYPKTDVAKNKAKDDFWPNFRASPPVAQRILGGLRHKYRKSTLLNMQYPGGSFKFASAESPSETVSIPVDTATLDERDRQKDGEAGDLKLGIMQRQGRIPNPKLIEASTPLGGMGESKILQSATMPGADQTTPHLVCLNPKCQHEFAPEWEMVDIAKDDAGALLPDGAVLLCPSCGHRHSDAELITMMGNVRECHLKQMGKFGCCGETHDPAKVRQWNDKGLALCPTCRKPRSKLHRSIVASFIWSGTTLRDKVYQFIVATTSKDPGALKRFYNEALARPFEPKQNLEPTMALELADRRENLFEIYGNGVQVPAWAKNLVMSTDVQRKNGGRLEWQLMACGDNDETMVIRYGRIPGAANDPAVWFGEPEMDEHGDLVRNVDGSIRWKREGLEQVRTRFYPGVEGRLYPVSMAVVDIGDQADAITKTYTDRMAGKGVAPVRGRPGEIDFFTPEMSFSERHKHAHFAVGVWAGRDILSHRLRLRMPADPHVRVPGALRFAADVVDESTGEVFYETGIIPDYFDQLTNFKVKLKSVGGQLVEKWVEESNTVPEEALDNTLYCWWAQKWLCHVNHVSSTNDLPPKWITREQAVALGVAASGVSPTAEALNRLPVAGPTALPGVELEEDGTPRNIPPKALPAGIVGLNSERDRRRSTSDAGLGRGMYANDPRSRGGRR